MITTKINGDADKRQIVWWMERKAFFILSNAYFSTHWNFCYRRCSQRFGSNIVSYFHHRRSQCRRRRGNKLRQEKVSDRRRYLLARYGIWLIFFHKSASCAQTHEQLNSGEKERRKRANGKSALKRKMMSIYLLRFVVCHSQFDVLYLSVLIWMSYTHTNGEQGRWRINVNLHSHRAHPCTERTVRFLTVNSNKHAIYINFLCHIFIHFGERERVSESPGSNVKI